MPELSSTHQNVQTDTSQPDAPDCSGPASGSPDGNPAARPSVRSPALVDELTEWLGLQLDENAYALASATDYERVRYCEGVGDMIERTLTWLHRQGPHPGAAQPAQGQQSMPPQDEANS